MIRILVKLLKGDVKPAIIEMLEYMSITEIAIQLREFIKSINVSDDGDVELILNTVFGDLKVRGKVVIHDTCTTNGLICVDPVGYMTSMALLKGSVRRFKSVREFMAEFENIRKIENSEKIRSLLS